MKNIRIRAFDELDLLTEETGSPLSLHPKGEDVLLWKENSTVKMSDEELLKNLNAIDKLLLILVARQIMVNARLMCNMLNQYGIAIEYTSTHTLLNKLASRGILTSCVLVRKDNPGSSLQFYSVGGRGVVILRSLNISFYNMRLPSLKTAEKLKSVMSTAQAANALAEDAQHIKSGFVLILKKNDSVWNNVRAYTASRGDTTYFIESVRRGKDSAGNLNEKLQRIDKALNPEYQAFRENYDIFGIQQKQKLVIVCEDAEHIREIRKTIEMSEALADIAYFTYDASTYSSEVALYKYEKLIKQSTNDRNTAAYQLLLSEMNREHKSPCAVMRSFILDWAHGFAADERFLESAQCLYLSEVVSALEEGRVDLGGKS